MCILVVSRPSKQKASPECQVLGPTLVGKKKDKMGYCLHNIEIRNLFIIAEVYLE